MVSLATLWNNAVSKVNNQELGSYIGNAKYLKQLVHKKEHVTMQFSNLSEIISTMTQAIMYMELRAIAVNEESTTQVTSQVLRSNG